MTTSQILNELDLRYRELSILEKKKEVLNISLDEIDYSEVLFKKIVKKKRQISNLINVLPIVNYVVLEA